MVYEYISPIQSKDIQKSHPLMLGFCNNNYSFYTMGFKVSGLWYSFICYTETNTGDYYEETPWNIKYPRLKLLYVIRCAIWDHLYNLKNVKSTHGGVLILVKVAGLKPPTLLKLTLLPGCFSRFLNCTNGTKSRNASHIEVSN